ncbi:hypothetical protein GWK47_018628 [Chionoecetes opilio]|uniref:Uncharacterized protein n=1 Tax=Chionoecetes opilio TaxID=41210 RepID=A0A8J4XT41_CHIOP|nr:hypothetical protein GWK47_018628 [Chionoecetes opilio]
MRTRDSHLLEFKENILCVAGHPVEAAEFPACGAQSGRRVCLVNISSQGSLGFHAPLGNALIWRSLPTTGGLGSRESPVPTIGGLKAGMRSANKTEPGRLTSWRTHNTAALDSTPPGFAPPPVPTHRYGNPKPSFGGPGQLPTGQPSPHPKMAYKKHPSTTWGPPARATMGMSPWAVRGMGPEPIFKPWTGRFCLGWEQSYFWAPEQVAHTTAGRFQPSSPFASQIKTNVTMSEGTEELALAAMALETCIQAHQHINRNPKTKKRMVKTLVGQKVKNVFNNLLKKNVPGGFSWVLRVSQESKDNFVKLLNLGSPLIRKQDTKLRKAVSPAQRLSVTLRYLATGNTDHGIVIPRQRQEAVGFERLQAHLPRTLSYTLPTVLTLSYTLPTVLDTRYTLPTVPDTLIHSQQSPDTRNTLPTVLDTSYTLQQSWTPLYTLPTVPGHPIHLSNSPGPLNTPPNILDTRILSPTAPDTRIHSPTAGHSHTLSQQSWAVGSQKGALNGDPQSSLVPRHSEAGSPTNKRFAPSTAGRRCWAVFQPLNGHWTPSPR